MAPSPILTFEHVTKQYRLGQTQMNLRDTIATTVSRVVRPRRNQHAIESTPFLALDDISFDVHPGEIVGIIGHNGAGKSTALKLLSRVTYPTSGSIRSRGRIAALIELGAGFHPDLSGRENIYLNGAVMGLKRREIDAQFDSMIDFAGLERFVDTPIKRYSSGMYVRLAFAVAAHVRADLLLIDEVLSVGDTAFQQKCLNKMHELHDNGATIVFISHSMWTVQNFCPRVLLLSKGRLVADGSPESVIEQYQQEIREVQETSKSDQNADEEEIVRIDSLSLTDGRGQSISEIDFYSKAHLRLAYTANQTVSQPLVIVRICRMDGLVCCALNNRQDDHFSQHRITDSGILEIQIGPLQLVPDYYTAEVVFADSEQPLVYAHSTKLIFRVKGALSENQSAGVFAPPTAWSFHEN